MSNSDEETLMYEYVRRFNTKVFLLVRYTGFCRFDINNGQVVPKKMKSIIANLCLIVIVIIGITLIFSSSDFNIQLPEKLALIHFTVYVILRLLNLSFGTRYSGSELVKTCIKIDVFLGIKETFFMREVQFKFYAAMCFFIAIFQVVVNIYLYQVFDVSVKVHIIGTSYFIWLFFSYYDYVFLIATCTFAVLRVRYMNVALMKVTKIKPGYVPVQYLFHKLFWKKNFDKLVTFDTRAGSKDYTNVFRMLLNLYEDIGSLNRFSILSGVATIVVGSFVATQTLVMYAQTTEVDNTRAGVIVGWVIISWYFLLFCAQITDMFYKELEFTNLICAYSQLKPSNSPDIFKLTKDVARTLGYGEKRISIYGIVYYETGLILRLAASTLVYITVQLQMALPPPNEVGSASNNSTRILNN